MGGPLNDFQVLFVKYMIAGGGFVFAMGLAMAWTAIARKLLQ